MSKSPLLLLLILLCLACDSTPGGEGIYYWKTTWELGQAEQQDIKTSGLNRVYVRLFDLDKGPEDRGRIMLPEKANFSDSLTFVPVVFILNRVWQTQPDAANFTKALLDRVDYYFRNYPALAKSKELQIDCDWTALTRDAYFEMLHALKAARPELEISVTIRLHQYRERTKNGVPPADRGLLMCYNMGPVRQARTSDAIFDEDLLKGYLKAPEYPLPLDVALPLFQWGAAFRGGEFIGLTDHPSSFDSYGFEPLPKSSASAIVTKDTVLNGHFLRPGDVIRGDGITAGHQLRRARELLLSKTKPRYILYYDWQPGALDLLAE